MAIDEGILIFESAATFAMVDPTTVAGSEHFVINTSTAAYAITSVGATPFSAGGVLSATLTLLPGVPYALQSDGTHWVTRAGTGGRPFYAGVGTTDASGNVTFTFPVPFAVNPVIDVAFQGAASASPVDYRITALSTTAVTINVRQSLATVVALIGLTILAASAPLPGAVIHLMATPPGQTP